MQRMNERNVTRADIREGLASASSALREEADRWQLAGGHDLEGEALSLVVVLTGGCVVVTVF